jgi:hypothetical protein
MEEKKIDSSNRLKGLFEKLSPLAQEVHKSIIGDPEVQERDVPCALLRDESMPLIVKHNKKIVEEKGDEKLYDARVIRELSNFYIFGGFGFDPETE